jgi:hypothetical protein
VVVFSRLFNDECLMFNVSGLVRIKKMKNNDMFDIQYLNKISVFKHFHLFIYLFFFILMFFFLDYNQLKVIILFPFSNISDLV